MSEAMPDPTEAPHLPPLDVIEAEKALPGLQRLRDEWLEHPELQTEGAWAREGLDGKPIPPGNTRATCWCMEGWVTGRLLAPTRHATLRALRVAARRLGYRSVPAASDSGLAARHQVVTTALNSVAERLRQGGGG